MARARKAQPTLDSIFFSTPEQKVVRFLLSEPTTAFTPRVISSRLKGIRGLGGTEGIAKVLNDLAAIGLVEFVDNERAVRLKDDAPVIGILKMFAAVCDLEGLKVLLEPHSSKGVLVGDRAAGKACTDSTYDLFVVSDNPDEVKRIASHHPLSKQLEVQTYTPDAYETIERRDPGLTRKIAEGVVVWGRAW